MNTKQVLIAARKKIERPECWTKGAHARDADGEQVMGYVASSVCWCVIGAIQFAVDGAVDYNEYATPAIIALRRALGREDLVGFNDAAGTTHADVLALFDRAIAATQ